MQPDLFIVFDRVESTNPDFKKRWLLHTAVQPTVTGATVTAANGDGRLWCRTLMPADPDIVVVNPPVLPAGQRLPEVDVTAYPPGYPGQWRVETSPREPAEHQGAQMNMEKTSSLFHPLRETTYPIPRKMRAVG